MNITCYLENIIINDFLLINIYKNFTKNIRVDFINEKHFFINFCFHKMIKNALITCICIIIIHLINFLYMLYMIYNMNILNDEFNNKSHK